MLDQEALSFLKESIEDEARRLGRKLAVETLAGVSFWHASDSALFRAHVVTAYTTNRPSAWMEAFVRFVAAEHDLAVLEATRWLPIAGPFMDAEWTALMQNPLKSRLYYRHADTDALCYREATWEVPGGFRAYGPGYVTDADGRPTGETVPEDQVVPVRLPVD